VPGVGDLTGCGGALGNCGGSGTWSEDAGLTNVQNPGQFVSDFGEQSPQLNDQSDISGSQGYMFSTFSFAFQVNVAGNLPPGTPQRYWEPLKQGLGNARKALKRKSCAAFYGGLGPQTLDATQYRFLDMQSPTTGAATISPTSVFINSKGPFITYAPAVGQIGPFGRAWTQGQFRGFILLHELGHQLSDITNFKADAGSPLNQVQSRRVLSACF
jgi:hypothetical protein